MAAAATGVEKHPPGHGHQIARVTLSTTQHSTITEDLFLHDSVK